MPKQSNKQTTAVCDKFARMHQSGPDPQVIQENIARAKARRDAALLELEAATRELDWWREGLAMFDPQAAEAETDEERADARIRQLIPDGFDTPNPSVRQMILFAMRADPYGEWSIPRISDVIVMHRWADPNAEDLLKRITDMTAAMARDELLTRIGRGVYRLPELLGGALSRALRPITDYSVAARHGLPVPERPVYPPSRQRLKGHRTTASDIRTSHARE